MRILVADDEPGTRLLLCGLLRSLAVEVLTASDGHAAWECIERETEPLLALLDWQMPGWSGVEICQHIRRLPASHLVYAILVTGQTGQDSLVRGLESGAHDYVCKPFDSQVLLARIQVGLRVLALQQALADQVRELEATLNRVKVLQGLVPICTYCKSIRTDKDYWQQVEHYLAEQTDARFSHGICPECYAAYVDPQLAALRRKLAEENRP
ncbi:MAG: response regulator [Gemmataceae bacterium]